VKRGLIDLIATLMLVAALLAYIAVLASLRN
jgi:hypothetical protein